jgi:hypothetical protein
VGLGGGGVHPRPSDMKVFLWPAVLRTLLMLLHHNEEQLKRRLRGFMNFAHLVKCGGQFLNSNGLYACRVGTLCVGHLTTLDLGKMRA